MTWVSLFSGGKDSSWALYRALETGRDVSRLVTVHPSEESYMYHVPATHLAELAAESLDIPLLEIAPDDLGAPEATDSSAQGDAELEPLEDALTDLGDVSGVVAGAVESAYQTDRIAGMCERLGADLYSPLYGEDPESLAEQMLDAGFEIQIVQVAAYGLDESWLGRTFDRAALADLRALNEEYGVHVLGEGGEFETIVTDGPHMDRAIDLSYETVWEGTRGHVRVTDARLV
ncbi:MAG: diphthine--ammonia ligase [Halobacteriaceae archaeon]